MSSADFVRALRAALPLRLDAYMARCNAHYYATRDPLGADFITAPEVSQMFGELVGLWLADIWQRAGAPHLVRLVELGPGRGTLLADALRATARVAGFHDALSLHLIETSPTLRGEQAKRMARATWHDSFDDVPNDAPLLLIANEFFDALPIRQIVHHGDRAEERHVVAEGAGLGWSASGDEIEERNEAGVALAAAIGARLADTGGAALIIDYGHGATQRGDSLQALRGGASVDPLSAPGDCDLTAHVDFAALGAAARNSGATVHGLVRQGDWLDAMGLPLRAEALKARATPAQAAAIEAARVRLSAPQQMGSLFKVMMWTGRGWPIPAGGSA